MKLFVLFFSHVILAFDPYIYMCLIIYTENKDYIVSELQNFLQFKDDRSQDYSFLKKKSDRINQHLYNQCYQRMQKLSPEELAATYIQMNKIKRCPLNIDEFVPIKSLQNSNWDIPTTQEELETVKLMNVIKQSDPQKLKLELFSFIEKHIEKPSQIETMKYLFGSIYEQGLLKPLFLIFLIIFMIGAAIYILQRENKQLQTLKNAINKKFEEEIKDKKIE